MFSFKQFMLNEIAPGKVPTNFVSPGNAAQAGARQPHMYYHAANTPSEPLIMHQQFSNPVAQSAFDTAWRGRAYNDLLMQWVNQVATHIANLISNGETTNYHGKTIVAKQYIDTVNREIIKNSNGRVTHEFAIAELKKNGAIKEINIPVYKINDKGFSALEKGINNNIAVNGIDPDTAQEIINYINYLTRHTSKNAGGKELEDKGPLPAISNKYVLEAGHFQYVPQDFAQQTANPDLLKIMLDVGLLQPIDGLPCYEISIMALKGMQLKAKGLQKYRQLWADIMNRTGSNYQNQYIKQPLGP